MLDKTPILQKTLIASAIAMVVSTPAIAQDRATALERLS